MAEKDCDSEGGEARQVRPGELDGWRDGWRGRGRTHEAEAYLADFCVVDFDHGGGGVGGVV